MDPNIIAAIIAAVVSLIVILATILMTGKHHKSSVYKDTILNFKLDWLEKLRQHLMCLAKILNTYADKTELDEIYYKTELILNTSDSRRVFINSLAKQAIDAHINNDANKKEVLETFVQKSRICLEIEWILIRKDISGFFKKKRLDQKILNLEGILIN